MPTYPQFPQYTCDRCSIVSKKWRPKCPRCLRVGAMHPVGMEPKPPPPKYQPASATRPMHVERLVTGISSVDDVFGGGLPTGAAIVLAAGQGCGKSTLALQIAAGVGGRRAFYVSAEEPPDRVRLRIDQLGLADRLANGANGMDMPIPDLRDMGDIRDAMASTTRALVVVDSLSQLRDARQDTPDRQQNLLRNAMWFFHDATRSKRCYLLIGRLNKKDDIAGIRDVEYELDATAHLIRNGRLGRKIVCPEKNRFHETGIVREMMMTAKGLVPCTGYVEAPEDDADGERRRDAEPF